MRRAGDDIITILRCVPACRPLSPGNHDPTPPLHTRLHLLNVGYSILQTWSLYRDPSRRRLATPAAIMQLVFRLAPPQRFNVPRAKHVSMSAHFSMTPSAYGVKVDSGYYPVAI